MMHIIQNSQGQLDSEAHAPSLVIVFPGGIPLSLLLPPMKAAKVVAGSDCRWEEHPAPPGAECDAGGSVGRDSPQLCFNVLAL
mmetsp:Transcript_56582/g.134791  ORF Transcript_56582/g.134791 Transcript_56582/m.134791 type:complete len:83 (-) Transcript_56582:62-310(-)